MPSHTEYEMTRLTKDKEKQKAHKTFSKDVYSAGNVLFMHWLIDNHLEDAAIHYCTIYPKLTQGCYNTLGDSLLSRANGAGCKRLSSYLVNKNVKRDGSSSNLATQLAAVTFHANKPAHTHSAGETYATTMLTQFALSSSSKLALATKPHKPTKKTSTKPA